MWPHPQAANHPVRLVSILKNTSTKPTAGQKTVKRKCLETDIWVEVNTKIRAQSKGPSGNRTIKRHHWAYFLWNWEGAQGWEQGTNCHMHQWPNPNHHDRGWKWHHSLWFGTQQWWHYTTIAVDLMARSKSCLKAEDKTRGMQWVTGNGRPLPCLLDEVKLILFRRLEKITWFWTPPPFNCCMYCK